MQSEKELKLPAGSSRLLGLVIAPCSFARIAVLSSGQVPRKPKQLSSPLGSKPLGRQMESDFLANLTPDFLVVRSKHLPALSFA